MLLLLLLLWDACELQYARQWIVLSVARRRLSLWTRGYTSSTGVCLCVCMRCVRVRDLIYFSAKDYNNNNNMILYCPRDGSGPVSPFADLPTEHKPCSENMFLRHFFRLFSVPRIVTGRVLLLKYLICFVPPLRLPGIRYFYPTTDFVSWGHCFLLQFSGLNLTPARTAIRYIGYNVKNKDVAAARRAWE